MSLCIVVLHITVFVGIVLPAALWLSDRLSL